jgi:N-acetylglucosaminyldiphosphoundecaprenol N-acetyl-beta-D-mannosaminyltransferase
VIFGFSFVPLRFAAAIDRMLDMARSDRAYMVSTCTVYTVMRACEETAVREALQNADLCTTDGMPLVWLLHQQGHREAERVYGPDILHEMCRRTADLPIRHYFWGSTPETLEALVARLQALYPGLTICGAHSPPFAPQETDPDAETVRLIRAAQPHIVWVGLGSPRQDVWMHLYRPLLDAPLLVGVGAAFDFVSGRTRQAPRWMQRHGLEWLFRLIQNPRQLARRYFVYNTKFIWRLMRGRWQDIC